MTILLIVVVVMLVICAYNLIRNCWVCNTRLKWIKDDYRLFDTAPDYDHMLYIKFWKWSSNIQDWIKK